MRVRITMPSKDAKRIKEKVMAEVDEVEEEDMGAECGPAKGYRGLGASVSAPTPELCLVCRP
jgi:hypothetical protein